MPQHTITILLGLVFCIMNPIITPVCLIYFLITTVTEKYNLLYVYTFEYQSGGQVSILEVLCGLQPATQCCIGVWFRVGMDSCSSLSCTF